MISGCAKQSDINDLQKQIDDLKSSDQIQTISGQITSINNSLTSLQNTDSQLKTYIETLQGQAESLETVSKNLEDAIAKMKEELKGEISAAESDAIKKMEEMKSSIDDELETIKKAIGDLQKKDEDLQKQIDDLKNYTDTQIGEIKDWAKATFATLEEYNKTAKIVAGIQARIDALESEITADYTTALTEAIAKSEEAMKTWINEQLTGYYTIAEMDTRLGLLEDKLDAQKKDLKELIDENADGIEKNKESIEKNTAAINDLKASVDENAQDISNLTDSLAAQKTAITTAYTKVIKAAVENQGTINKTVQDTLAKHNSRLIALDSRVTQCETDIAAIKDEITKIKTDIADLQKDVKGLLSRIQSIAYIPKYSDNKERVKYIFNGTKYITSDLSLRFDVYPADCADSIVTAYGKNNSIISARAVYTLTKATAGDFVNLSVSNVTASSDGILTVTVSPDGLDKDFFDGKYEASLVLKISTGYSNIQSDYIGLVAPISDLSASESANCYLVQAAGVYKFMAVKGNTFKKDDSGKTGTSVGTVASADVLWESFGTATAPKKGELIASATYSDGYIKFSTPADFKQGNAVIAAKDKDGTILWSWHIWCAKEGWKEQVYKNNAGTMMDRNLGAISATPGDVGSLGLLYQWGRKDPFLGSSSVSSATQAASTGTWDTSSNSVTENSTKNPTIFYTGSSNCMPDKSWDKTKTVNDPCPAGWRVPDGGGNGIWSTAKGSSDSFSIPEKFSGLNFGNVFGSDETIWYPASGYLNKGALSNVGFIGSFWSVTPDSSSSSAYCLYFYSNGNVFSSDSSSDRSTGRAVRCLQE